MRLVSHEMIAKGGFITAASVEKPISITIQEIYTYLPLVAIPDHFPLVQPIWVEGGSGNHQVALFRFAFMVDETLDAEISIFAESRYQLWLDGSMLGRGPARYTKEYREVDQYPLGVLGPGEHLIAVLVQWSPEDRRSEALFPHLKALLRGHTDSGRWVFLPTGLAWKGILSPAWNLEAVPVHRWNLIGATELLDLNQILPDWNQTGFNDADWPFAILAESNISREDLYLHQEYQYGLGELIPASPLAFPSQFTEIEYHPRTISPLVEIPITSTLLDAGVLSPGFLMSELSSLNSPFILGIPIQSTSSFTVETLQETLALGGLFTVDGNPLSWASAESSRPDVMCSAFTLGEGLHQLSISGIPAEGLTWSLSNQQGLQTGLPFVQGVHAGRRLLLANPIPDAGRVSVYSAGDIDLLDLPAYLVLDLGRSAIGRLVMDIQGVAGTVVDIGWDERLLPDTLRPLPYPGSAHAEWNQVDSWVLDGGWREVSTLDARTGRYILIAAWGTGSVQLRNIRVLEERYPVEQRGSFSSSDPLLDQIWQVGVDTAMINMTDGYVDPWRERGQWWGDAYVIDHVNRVAFGDADLLRRGILLMRRGFAHATAPGLAPHGDGGNMLDYAMLWVHGLFEYYLRTGDIEPLLESYPTLSQFMTFLNSYEEPGVALMDLPKEHWWQTAYIDTNGFHSRYGYSTAVNALYAGTLDKAAEIARALGESGAAQGWQTHAEEVRTALNMYLYQSSSTQYLTHIYQGDSYPPTPHSQAWALAYEVVPTSDIQFAADALVDMVATDPSQPNIQVYGMYWVLEGLGKSGHIDQALEIIRRYYGYMLQLGASTWWENFGANLKYNSSLSHGWGGSPTWFLTTYVLGAEQTGPTSWRVMPALSGVEQALGALPLANQEELWVDWRRLTCSQSTVTISSPLGSSGEFLVRARLNPVSILLNGEIVWNADGQFSHPVFEDGSGVHIPLSQGEHFIEVTHDCSR